MCVNGIALVTAVVDVPDIAIERLIIIVCVDGASSVNVMELVAVVADVVERNCCGDIHCDAVVIVGTEIELERLVVIVRVDDIELGVVVVDIVEHIGYGAAERDTIVIIVVYIELEELVIIIVCVDDIELVVVVVV